MRKSFLPLFLLFLFSFLASGSYSQADKFAYAITDLQPTGSGWNALRMLNTQTGVYTDILLNGADQKQVAFDAVTKKQFVAVPDAKFGNYLQPAFSTGVAALAYDRNSKRLYFTPMFIDQLRYIDLRTMKVYYITGRSFSNAGDMKNDEAKIVTRMVIAPDGNGYAISNDGNYFIRFSADRRLKITELGSLIDDPANNGVSIHDKCSGFGGDMVADDAGNLFIITASRNVYKINIESRIASYQGSVKGLPGNFTVNGIVVNEDGKLLVSSAVNADAYYLVNPKDWTSVVYKSAKGIFKSSDLANSNYLITKNSQTTIATLQDRSEILNDNIQLYPNPVSHNSFAVHFNKLYSGNYIIALTDIMGRQVLQRKVNVMGSDQTESISISPVSSKGIYMVKVINEQNKTLFYQKLVVQ
ncbi:MAG TPA: T9SS type A sorting domain-containing protein [Chitinophagaceae bacterium]|jgi:hypothetical protein